MNVKNAQKPLRLPAYLLIALVSLLFSVYTAIQYYLSRIAYEGRIPGRAGQYISAISDWVGLLPKGCLRYVSIRELVIFVLCLMICLLAGYALLNGRRKWLHFICINRWWIGLALFVLFVLLQWNNTSLRQWVVDTGSIVDSAPLWGRARGIRTDEWAVWTPMAISQSSVGYPALSPLIATGNIETLWNSVGGLPAWNAATIFKPFYWGFLLADLASLSVDYGLSWLWAARWIFCALVTFEFGLRITKRNYGLSFAMALLIVFCPYIQWWYSQSVAEVVIFSEAALLCLWKYVDSESLSRRVCYGILAAWMIGCLVMIAYPAWIIPQIQVTLAMSVLILVQNRKRLHRRDAVALSLPLLAVIGYLVLIVAGSIDTLLAVANSTYPGNRLYTGGYLQDNLFTGLASALFSIVIPNAFNECELAGVFSLAPAGLLIGLDVLLLQKSGMAS